MSFHLSLLVSLLLSFIFQEFMPTFSWAYYSRLLLVPIVFFVCAVAVPFPLMLVFAFLTGLIWDTRHLVVFPENSVAMEGLSPAVLQGASYPAFGYSIVLYGLLGILMQGIRPLFRRGRYEMPVLMTGLATALLLTAEYLWISFLRGSFSFSQETWLNIGTTSLLSMMFSPLLFLFIHWLSRVSGYQIRYEGLKFRKSW